MCKQCEINHVYEFTNKRKLCKNCFINYFHKKVLYINRKFNMICRGDVIGYQKGNNVNSVVLKEVLNLFEEKGFIRQVGNKNKFDKLALPNNLDSESDKIIHELINGNIELNKTDKGIIKPLYLFSDREILLYAKIKRLKFIEKKIKKDKISLFVEDLEKKHPEIKRAIVNSYLGLNY